MPSFARRDWERVAVAAALLVGAMWLAVALSYARAAIRDDLRLDDLTHLRHGLEMYYNAHNAYPTPPNGQAGCTDSNDAASWLFRTASPLLQERLVDAIPHDVRERRGFVYTYCVTFLSAAGADGYYLQALLENDRPIGSVFDEDEKRKFYYRILPVDNNLVLRTCGGSEKQCEDE